MSFSLDLDLISVISIILIGGIIGSFSTVHGLEFQRDDPAINLTCPKPEVNIDNSGVSETRDQLRSPSKHSYIQKPSTDVEMKKKKDSIEIRASSISRPEGSSMRPTIFTGNTVILEKYKGDEEKLDSGTIIRYQTGSEHVIHRIKANYLDTQDKLLVKGDNTDYTSKIDEEDVTHIVTGVIYN